MTTLYDILGVKKDATPEEIKAAKRKLARKHHPDKGGNVESMALINRAADVLENPKKRAYYDQTGMERVPDETDEALKLFVEVLSQSTNNPDLFCFQILNATRDKLREQSGQVVVARDQVKDAIAKFKRRMGKSKYKGKKNNMIDALTDNTIKQLEVRLVQIEEIINTKRYQRALKHLADYEALDEEQQAATVGYFLIS